jgi:CBS domain containing-hemolysin-like protein
MKELESWKLFLILTLVFIMTQGLFSMIEMACVSFNKVRLQYWVSKGHRRAKWLSHLLQRPTLLFGSTLIGVTASIQIGSECSRRLYESWGLSPDWAPLSQIVIVLIFAELAPMFAGRRYAEHVAMLGVPLIYGASILLRPLIWFFDLLCLGINRLIKSPGKKGMYLSRDELQHVFEQLERPGREVNDVVGGILGLKAKRASDLMLPLSSIQMVPDFCRVGEMRALLSAGYAPYLPLYQRHPENIIGIAYPRDLLRLDEQVKVREHARPPWFITTSSPILHILKQFRINNQSLAVVLNEGGAAAGILTLDQIIDSIFGTVDNWEAFGDMAPRMHHVVVDRIFSGDLSIGEFNTKFQVHLEGGSSATLEELFEDKLGHSPEKGETLQIDQFELTVEEAPLIGPKKISVRTVF